MDNVTSSPRVLGNRYEVADLVGRGGMAEVHLGRDTRLGRAVAIKILRFDLARDAIFQARFRREAQSAASLNHPSIVAVYDTGEEQVVDGAGNLTALPYIVMEYIEGRTVRDLLNEQQQLPLNLALEITSGVLSALEYSHRAGIVHRDIKPANVMVTPTGEVKVMDFGIARAMADASATMTQTQAVIGTAQYLSPEQARGETVDARSDLYSTGCLLFEVLAGRPPFVGDSPVAVAYQHVREQPPSVSTYNPDLPPDADRVVMHALAKDREDRYQSAAEFRSDIDRLRRGQPILAAAATERSSPTVATGVVDGEPTVALSPSSQVPPFAPVPQPDYDTRRARATTASKSNRGFAVLLGLSLVIIVVGLGFFFYLQNNRTNKIEIPDVVGRNRSEAEQILRAKKLTPDPDPMLQKSEKPKGTVISQNPSSGLVDASALTNNTVKLTVSSGPGTTQVPDVINDSQEDARQKLIAAGLSPGNSNTIDDPTVEKDHVVKTDPTVGTTVSTGRKVTIYVASGLIDVPNLVNMTYADAVNALKAKGLKAAAVGLDPNNPDPQATSSLISYVDGTWLVTLQSLSAQTKTAVGSTVTLTVGPPQASTSPSSSSSSTSSPAPTDSNTPSVSPSSSKKRTNGPL